MTSTVFIDYVTPVPAAWLNDVNAVTYNGVSANAAAIAAETARATAAEALLAPLALSVEKTSATGGALIPSGTTAQRDATPTVPELRFNTDYQAAEVYNPAAAAWSGLGGASGSGGDAIFYNNGIIVNNSYTIPANMNSMTAGPIAIGASATVTIQAGSTWSIV